jgi:hypothetical protein
VALDDPTITYDERGGDLVKLHLDNGVTTRVCLISEKVEMVLVHYIGKKYMRCRSDQPDGCPGCEHKGEPRNRFGTNVIWYETSKDGTPRKPLQAKVALWTFGNDKFVQLKAAKQEWGDLRKHDLRIQCSDKQYQRFVITPCKEALWLSDQAFATQMAARIKEEKYDVLKIIGKVYSRAEMIAGLREEDSSIKPDPNTDEGGASVDVTDDGPAAEALPEADFDNLLADL